MNSLRRDIQHGVWMMEASTLMSYAPVAIAFAMGARDKFPEMPEQKDTIYSMDQSGSLIRVDDEDSVENAVMSYDVKGVITKEDQFCGPRGMVSLLNSLRASERNDRIVAHVLNIDSGGGQAKYMNTMATKLREEIKKPLLVSFNGMLASAAYYLASASDGIYAQESTDLLGSIGTRLTFAELTKYYEKIGIKIHDVLATGAELKGKILRDAEQDEDYTLLREIILDPLNEQFTQTIKAYRPELTDEDAYKAGLFSAGDAPEGMIDGIMSYEDLLAQAYNQGTQQNSNSQKLYTMPNANEKYPKMMATLGLEELEQQEDGDISLSADQLEAIEQALPSEEESVIETDQLADLNSTIQEMSDKINSLEQEVKTISGKTGADPSDVKSDEDPESGAEISQGDDANDVLERYNQAAEENAKTGRKAGFH